MRRSVLAGLATVLALVVGTGPAALPSAAGASTTTTTTVSLSTPTSAYGQTVTATAVVTSASALPEGDVVFSVDGLAKKVNLGADGVATLILPRAAVGPHGVSATYVPFPASDQGSASPTLTWTVAQVRTRLQVRVIGRGARIPTSVQVKAAGEFGSLPTGRVEIVVRHVGDRRGTKVVQPLSSAGVVLAGFGRLRKGDHRLVVTYVGDSQHLQERRASSFHVRKR